MQAMARISAPWRRFVGIALVLLAGQATAAPATAPVPGAEWERIASPEAVGWSAPKLAQVREYSKGIGTSAMVLVVNGRVLDEWGRTRDRSDIRSIRKSILNGLVGMAVGEGKLRLDATLAELGIDDNAPSLTEAEKRATVGDLLKARSGVYHPTLYETPAMAQARPARGSHPPGSFWYYNNWDFNALNTIYEAQAKTRFYTAFTERLAQPLQMQDWRTQDGAYFTGEASVHAAYPMHMSARDLARFGLLYLRGGQWGGKQLIPAAWIQQSLQPYSDAGEDGGYGHLWWVAVDGRHLPGMRVPEGTFSAQGYGGHMVVVVPSHDLVVVHRVDTDIPGNVMSDALFGQLLQRILDARLGK